MKSVFEKYLSNTPKYANQIQIQIQIFHLVVFEIQIQIQIFAYLNTNTNTYLTPALCEGKILDVDFRIQSQSYYFQIKTVECIRDFKDH